ncbi:MAG TPA: cation diffusion facilitator family transporter [Verrucomicrobiae bacterium]|jgi:cation diffusion facilitator family transporter
MPTARLKRSLRTTFLGLAVNAVLAGTKMAAGIFGHSHALVADAVESLADVFSSIVVWRGVVVAAEPPDEDHPYGHGKAEPLAAAVVSAMLLVAAGWIVIGAFRAIAEPHPAPKPFTLIVLVAVILLKEALFRFALHEAVSVDSSAVATDAWHHRSDAITSFAAAIGITVALLGGQGFESADDWAAIAAACVIAWNGWRLLRPALNELMDRSPNREVIDRIRAVAEAVPGVARVEKCLVRQMGYQYFVDMHVEVDPQMTVLRSHEIAHQVKDNVRAQVPRVRDVLVHIEPQGQLTAAKTESQKQHT